MQTRIVNEGKEELPGDLEAIKVEAAAEELEVLDLAAQKQKEMHKLNAMLDDLEKRHKVLSMKKVECREEALKAKKAGDQSTALKWIHRMNVFE